MHTDVADKSNFRYPAPACDCINLVYRTAQKFSGTKLWQIWWTIGNTSKFYPPNVVSSNSVIMISRQNFLHQFSCSSKSAKVLSHQSFVLYGSFLIPLHMWCASYTNGLWVYSRFLRFHSEELVVECGRVDGIRVENSL